MFRTIILMAALVLSPAAAEAAKVCLPCPAGSYSDGGTESKCKACDDNTKYCPGSTGKQDCPSGSKSFTGSGNAGDGDYTPGATSKSDCKTGCEDGQYYNGTTCMDCPAGTYQDATGHQNTSCKACGTIVSSGTGWTYCPIGTTTDWSCRTSPLGSKNQNSGYFGDAYKTNNGKYCHCRRGDQGGAWSSWVFFDSDDFYNSVCSVICVKLCSNLVSRWDGGARW
ncbi:MAG: hypothetical protein LBI17_03845 [Rickettsiales bacterium]|nr:hypothetical protein [Rickettsiales bacterium]